MKTRNRKIVPTLEQIAEQLADTFMIRYHEVFIRTKSEAKARKSAWKAIAKILDDR